MTPGSEGMWSYSDKLRFGIATEVPFGLRTSYSSNFVGRYQALVPSITYVELPRPPPTKSPNGSRSAAVPLSIITTPD